MPWRSVQDELGKYRCVDHQGRMYQGTPYAVEPAPTEKALIAVCMMHDHFNWANLVMTTPDVTCPGDVVDNDGFWMTAETKF